MGRAHRRPIEREDKREIVYEIETRIENKIPGWGFYFESES